VTDSGPRLSAADAAALEGCLAGGGVALFPADTVYGLACDPHSEAAVERLYRLKDRSPDRPAAVMFFQLEAARNAVPELGERTHAALERLFPGAITVLLPNPERRFPLACGPDPDRLGLRVPQLAEPTAALAAVGRPALQSSANPSGGPDPHRLADVDGTILRSADLVLDGGELPGTPSTVVDLTRYDRDGGFEIVREGAVPRPRLDMLL
jgi:L-threonylcarbamoyladenylate synthase